MFGSVARNEQRSDSDIDILIDTDPAIVSMIFDYAGLKDYVAGLFGGRRRSRINESVGFVMAGLVPAIHVVQFK